MRQIIILMGFIFALGQVKGQDSVNNRIKTYFKENKKNKTFRIKVKERGITETFYYDKGTKKLSGYSINQEEGLKKYYFKESKLLFLIHKPKKDYTDKRKGGLYYFEGGNLIEKEEFDIKPIDIGATIADSKEILSKAVLLLSKKHSKKNELNVFSSSNSFLLHVGGNSNISRASYLILPISFLYRLPCLYLNVFIDRIYRNIFRSG